MASSANRRIPPESPERAAASGGLDASGASPSVAAVAAAAGSSPSRALGGAGAAFASARAPTPPRRHAALATGLLAVAAAALPLGLDRVGAAPLLGAGYALDPTGAEAAGAPLAALVVRLFACLPLGDLATRANLAAALIATGAAVLLARLVLELLVELEGRVAPAATGAPGSAPGVIASSRATSAAARPLFLVAAAGAVAAPALSLGVFLAATSAPAVPLTLLVVTTLWLAAVRLLRAPGSARDGLWLGLASGLALGVDPVALLVGWPVALHVWTRSWRRGARWTRLAPVLALVGAAAVVVAMPRGGFAWPWHAALAAARTGLLSGDALGAGREALAQLGVVGALLMGGGLVVLVLQAPGVALLWLVAAVTALLVVAGQGAPAPGAAGSPAWAVLLAATAAPLAIGMSNTARKLGAARTATCAALVVVTVCWPLLEGGGFRWRRAAALPEQLLESAHRALPPRAVVDPGSEPMRALLGYGQALGLRPDLTIQPPAQTPRSPSPHLSAR